MEQPLAFISGRGKFCTACEEFTDNFSKDKRHLDGLQSECRICSNKRSTRWRETNLEQARAADRLRRKSPKDLLAKSQYDKQYKKTPKAKLTTRQKLLKKYWPDLSSEQAENEYARLLLKQGGECALGIGHKSTVGKPLCIDHNHTTGEVRGLLCDNCNRGIGLLKEDPQTLEAAIDYLRPRLKLVTYGS